MGNIPIRIKEAELSADTIVKFMEKETRRWSEIRANIQESKWTAQYLENEMKTTVDHWNKMQKVTMADASASKTESKQEKSLVKNLEKENQSLKKDVQRLQRANKSRSPNRLEMNKPSGSPNEVASLKENIDALKATVASLEEEKRHLMLRLSKIAGEKLMDNNPDIADLSDQNRPTKLGEMYSELYDNEWTDAFEALTEAGHSEETAIETLDLTLTNVFSFCEKKAGMLIHKAANAVDVLFEEYTCIVGCAHEKKPPSHLTVRRKCVGKRLPVQDILLQMRWRPKGKKEDASNALAQTKTSSKQEDIAKIKKYAENKLVSLRKDVALSMIPLVQQAYIEASWSTECIPLLKPFIRQCLFICWMMVVQSPPMVLHVVEDNALLDKNYFKEYLVKGQTIRYVVWPPMLLHKDGPVVSKGVAQGNSD